MVKEKMILCDSDVLIELYKRNPKVIEILKQVKQEQMAVSSITVAELVYGARNKKELN